MNRVLFRTFSVRNMSQLDVLAFQVSVAIIQDE